MKGPAILSVEDTIYAVSMACACFVSYEVAAFALSGLVGHSDQYLGVTWATVATVFVFDDSRSSIVSAGFARLLATGVRFALCRIYLSLFPFTPVGLAVVLGAGTAVMIMLNRREDIATTGIATSVAMVVAAMSSHNALQQPLLWIMDTVVGVAVGVGVGWLRWSLTARRLRKEQDPEPAFHP